MVITKVSFTAQMPGALLNVDEWVLRLKCTKEEMALVASPEVPRKWTEKFTCFGQAWRKSSTMASCLGGHTHQISNPNLVSKEPLHDTALPSYPGWRDSWSDRNLPLLVLSIHTNSFNPCNSIKCWVL